MEGFYYITITLLVIIIVILLLDTRGYEHKHPHPRRLKKWYPRRWFPRWHRVYERFSEEDNNKNTKGSDSFIGSPSKSSPLAVKGGASTYYNWGLPENEDKIPYEVKCHNPKCDYTEVKVVEKEKCREYKEPEKCPEIIKVKEEHKCPKCSESIDLKCLTPPSPPVSEIDVDVNIDANAVIDTEAVIDVKPGVDMSKYILKSEVPPMPDMNNYILKSKIPPMPDMNNYILKSKIPACSHRPESSRNRDEIIIPPVCKRIPKPLVKDTAMQKIISSCNGIDNVSDKEKCCAIKINKLQKKYENNPYTYSIPNRFNMALSMAHRG